jgi:hypothetical protein
MKTSSEFKLACSKAGIFHFSYVKLQISSASNSAIINSINKPVNDNEGEIDETTRSEWFNAAINGIQSALIYIRRYTSENFMIQIICIKGVDLDTRSCDVEAAAFLAIVKVFMCSKECYHLELVGDKWDITFTTL